MYSVALLLVAVAAVAALNCNQQSDCMSVSDNYNYVLCVSGTCRCRTDLGFSGSATSSSKCSCPTPSNVYWGAGNPFCKRCDAPREIVYLHGMPFCVSGEECEQLQTQKDKNEIRKEKIRQLYEGLRPPTPILVMTGQIDVQDIFAANVRGRVTPVGSFESFEGVVEYFYGLASTSIIPSVNFVTLVADGNKVSVRVDILFNGTETQPTHNLTETGYFVFNDENKIVSFDLAILNLGAIIDPPVQAQPLVIQQLCAVLTTGLGGHPATCAPGTYVGSYSDFNDCVTFMNSIPFGSWNRANSNTVTCRLLHSLLTPFRPAVHCPHSGKTGGGACIDFPYESFYTNDFP